jgi:hypothetical protein
MFPLPFSRPGAVARNSFKTLSVALWSAAVLCFSLGTPLPAHQITDAQARQFETKFFLAGTDGWDPTKEAK